MKRGVAGFTLLEVMIAIAILAFSLMAIFNLQSTSLMGSARAQRVSIATLLARQKMAQVLLDIEAGIPKGEFPEEKEDGGSFEEERYPDYFWKLTIRKVDIPPPPLPEGGAEALSQVFTIVSDELSKSTREVHLSISYKESEEEEEAISLVTHVVKIQ